MPLGQHCTTSRSRISAGVVSLIIAMGMPLLGEHDLFQEPPSTPSQEGSGIVTGHVYCGDTHQLARFASVVLQPLELPGSIGKDLRTAVEMPTVTHTDLDGKFTVSDLLPGSYLVLAWLPGYVSPLARIATRVDNKDPERFLQILEAVLPRVEVKNHLTSTVDITLVPGAVVSGSVAYDDGSPAVGFHMKLLYPFGAENGGQGVKLGNSAIDFPGLGFDTTDDKGQYRLAGIPPGSYVVAASPPDGASRVGGIVSGSYKSVDSPSNSGFLQIFSGNVIRLKESKAFSIVDGEQRNGVDIVVPLRHLHQVAGVVVAASDGHLLKRGYVELLYADEQSVAQRTHVNDDGTFVLTFVQDGGYRLQVIAADRATGAPTGNAWPYREQIIPIEITGNVTDLIISLDAK
jgi:hypothetical protein